MPYLRTLVVGLLLACLSPIVNAAPAAPVLGKPPLPPPDVASLPGRGPRPAVMVTGNLNVNTQSREQTREFFNAVYNASKNIPIDSTADVAACVPGTNSTAFADATLLRINWFRAMAGVPAGITFDSSECADDQDAALMMSAEGALQHTGIPPNWDCFSVDGTNAAGNSDLTLGDDGPSAITGYIWDFGAANYEVGHRRYIIYPQTQIMAAGDVPAQGTNSASNGTWIFDANYHDSRPATTMPYVAWPPAGYAPFQVVYPQWSFALSNAYLGAAAVTMSSNGVAIPITVQPYATNYGEDTVVWYPSKLDPASYYTAFPFNGTDTVYNITVSNIVTPGGLTVGFAYSVTVFDPGVTGAGYVPLVVSGTNTPSLQVANPYTCTPANNPNTTGYQWFTATATNGDLADLGASGLTNFTITPSPAPYAVNITPTEGTGKCFHLCHTNPVTQQLQMKELLYPSAKTVLSFKSQLGYSTSNEVAQCVISTNSGTTWLPLFSLAGTNGPGQTAFTAHSYPLSNYVGGSVMVGFNYEFTNGSYYSQTNAYIGWCLTDIVVTNSEKLLNPTTNATASTNFIFVPAKTNHYVLRAQAVIFNQFGLDWGPMTEVAAIVGPPVIVLDQPTIATNHVTIKFALDAGAATTFHLLQTTNLASPWTTNGTATLTTNVAGASYQFTTTNGPGTKFYMVKTP